MTSRIVALPMFIFCLANLAHADWTLKDSGFLPKSTLACVDPRTGQSVRLTAHIEVTRGYGHIYHRQILTMNGESFASYFTTIPTQNEGLPNAYNDSSDKLYFRYQPAANWRKAGYDYDPGDTSARVSFMPGRDFNTAAYFVDHCR